MAINKPDFKTPEGNYRAENALMDAVIDGVNGNEANITSIGETGLVTFNNVVSGETVSQVISYTKTYSQEPRVVVTNASASPHGDFASVSNLTTTSFKINARHELGGSRDIYVVWIAMAQ